jgi:hypothetical protein
MKSERYPWHLILGSRTKKFPSLRLLKTYATENEIKIRTRGGQYMVYEAV